jgi:beta-galactosidase
MTTPAARLITLAILAPLFHPGAAAGQRASTIDTTSLRTTTDLNQNWRFTQDDRLTDQAALADTVSDWEAVTLPHTWNAHDAASLRATDYKRGRGWYRLDFNTPSSGSRHWLEIGAASLVADVWLNGKKLGQHKGGFTIFRFDVTDTLNRSGKNTLLIKVDNSEPKEEDDLTAIAPLGGDFNVSGGLYRYVRLISTAGPVHFDLADMGGPGVYANTTSVQPSGATVHVRTRLKNDSGATASYVVRVGLLDAEGRVAGSADRTVSLAAGTEQEIGQDIQVDKPHLWQGREDPYLYQLVAELLPAGGKPVDNVVQAFGIRQIRIDPDKGFYLNGKYLRLHGVAMHQDFLGKGWATSNADVDTSLALIMEIGANAVRLAHYPYSSYTLDRLSRLGLVAWSETALGLGTKVHSCSRSDATPAFVDNAKHQLQEMIRQDYNQAAIAMWAVGNETSARQLNCDDPYDNVTPVLRALHRQAKSEDESRPTVYAEYGHPADRSGPYATEGITDLFATNRYFLWYTPNLGRLDALLDSLRVKTPSQPLGVSEYGAGAALTHHTDNVEGGEPEVRSAPEGQVSYQPEEYQAYVHERNYRLFSTKRYLWGTFVWNMFDFGSGHRNEGDVLGVNTKGLVTFDRTTRKDAFYFYKANWTSQPVTHIVGRRYKDRAYALNDIKVYSNAGSVTLSVNGRRIGTMTAKQCDQKTCVFKGVRLNRGDNVVKAVGQPGGASATDGGTSAADSVRWSLNSYNVNIAAGRLATGYVSSQGIRYGSDNFYSGGSDDAVEVSAEPTPTDLVGSTATISGTNDPSLYKYYRNGSFSYDVPLGNGRYEVTLGFVEPDRNLRSGERVFDVTAAGKTELSNFDVLKEAKGQARTAVVRNFSVTISNRHLRLGFQPKKGKAVVSNISIRAR